MLQYISFIIYLYLRCKQKLKKEEKKSDFIYCYYELKLHGQCMLLCIPGNAKPIFF